MALLHLSELPLRRADEAFALVRLGTDWSQADWREWLTSSEQQYRGVLSVTALGGAILGLAAYSVRGGVLDVPLFLAFELGADGATRKALRDGLERLCDLLECDAVQYTGESRGLLVTSAA